MEQMLGDLQELNTREEVSKIPNIFNFYFQLAPPTACFYFLYLFFPLPADKVTKGVQLAGEEAEDLRPTRLCV